MSTDREMDKEDTVYKCNGIILSHKNNKIIPFEAIWMNLEVIILIEVNQDREPGRRPVQRVQGRDDEGLKKEAAVSMEEKENSEHMVQ